jgi:CheY-like chemotaxis protein
MWINVIDNGIGIPNDRIKDVVKEYIQIDNPERDRTKGFGLGLSIVDRLIRRLDRHELKIESIEGRGSRFSVIAPIAARIPPELLSGSVVEDGVPDLKGMVAILVEDDEETREAIIEYLNELGCYVVNGESAIEVIAQLRKEEIPGPHIILSDYRLREQKTGIDAIEAIRAEISVSSVPAVIYTAETAPETLQAIAKENVQLLPKPLDMTQLAAVLRKCRPQNESDSVLVTSAA